MHLGLHRVNRIGPPIYQGREFKSEGVMNLKVVNRFPNLFLTPICIFDDIHEVVNVEFYFKKFNQYQK